MFERRSSKRAFTARERASAYLWISLAPFLLLFSGSSLLAQSPEQNTNIQKAASPLPADPQETGRISGKVVDQTGATITGASVSLTCGSCKPAEVLTDEEGKFYFFDIPPGDFRLTFSFAGLASTVTTGTLQPGQSYVSPVTTLVIATQVTQVQVTLTPDQIATEQVKEQEKQRVFGVIPNFYVSYVPDAAPLKPRHKFELAWKSTTDPVTFAAVGLVAGVAQAGNRWSEYGQGAQGYAKRFGATYADIFTGTYIGGAILPTLLKQDPRYFYRGKGSTRSRLLYALASTVICKGDNGHWQPNYSTVLGNVAAGGISSLYYPSNGHSTVSIVFTTALVRMGEITAASIFQEFLVPRFTPNLRTRAPSQP
jgi:Carboxypeptidase regulatory-like domain